MYTHTSECIHILIILLGDFYKEYLKVQSSSLWSGENFF